MTDTINTSIVRLKNGDKSAFNEIYNNTYKIIYACSFKMLKNQQDTYDVVQNVYIKMLMKLDSLNDISKFNGWLMAITYNECKNMLKSRQNTVKSIQCDNDISDIEEFTDIEDTFSNPINITDEKELETEIKSIINQLPEEQQKVVLMYYYNQKTVDEIAKELNCSIGTIKSRLNYARKNLKKSVSFYEKKNNIKLHSSFIPLFLADLKAQITSLFITKAVVVASTLVIGTATVYNVSNYEKSKPPIQSPTINVVAEVTDTTKSKKSSEEKDIASKVMNESEVADNEQEVTTVTQVPEVSETEGTELSETTMVQSEVQSTTVQPEIQQTTINQETKVATTQQEETPIVSESDVYEEEPDYYELHKEDDPLKHNHQYFSSQDKLCSPEYDYPPKDDYLPEPKDDYPDIVIPDYEYDYKRYMLPDEETYK